MSVAFRRESDEEHKEPRFELPIPPGPNLVTPRGLRLIEARVRRIEADPVPVDEGDAAEQQRQLRYWRTRLATAQLAPPPPVDEVAIGSRVTIRLNGATRTIDVVGDDEAEPSADRLAFSAPLARALIGAMEGERVDFAGKSGAIEIRTIAPIPDDGSDADA